MRFQIVSNLGVTKKHFRVDLQIVSSSSAGTAPNLPPETNQCPATRRSLVSRAIVTDRELNALKPDSARYERAVAKARGLSVLIHPNGCKTFVVRYRSPGGARRRLALGDYPAVTLATARLQAGALRLEVMGGKDPAGERVAARLEARMGETLEQLAEGYWKAAVIGIHGGRKRPLRRETVDRQKSLWTRHLKPVLGGRRYKEMRRADVREFMQGLVLKGNLSPATVASIGDVTPRALRLRAASGSRGGQPDDRAHPTHRAAIAFTAVHGRRALPDARAVA
ncbi:integrase arm-type DNA-binding domain-containing protein [Phenylobacterium sp. LH3H17]|uniref:integrase arm-type DNA-binding domain-containing protein n=1 Tax=Phenylobacterium sp. LH3H17 TaxID=2903901 RepID=UPI003530EE0A